VNHEEELMERSVEVLAIILFGVFGLSHILQPRAWAAFFILLRSKREAGALVGWCLLIKGLIRFCAPKQALRIMARVSVERSWEFQVAGAALVALAGLLGYGVYAG
jgi:hypothetical protein